MHEHLPLLCNCLQNWEFEGYDNNRTNSYVRDGVLFLKPTLTSERYGEEFLTSGTLDMNGGAPYDQSVAGLPNSQNACCC